jgi:ribonuclease-3
MSHALETTLNYFFQNGDLLTEALTHRSFHKNKILNSVQNERLEFLGDAVLELVITDYLFKNYTQAEGYLTSLRASLVNYKILAQIGKEIELSKHILVSKSERDELGEVNLTILADCMEAIIGAIYLDSGVEFAKDFILPHLLAKLPEIITNKEYKDYKTRLQEYTQKYFKQTPQYKILTTSGKDHAKTFECGVAIDKKLLGIGKGKSKQDAETMAAKNALEKVLSENKMPEDI